MSDLQLLVCAIIIALIAGSFAGMLMYRLPIICQSDYSDLSLWAPRSHCPACQTTIAVRYLIPIVGYLLNKGHCATCRAPISLDYILIEGIFLLVPCALYLLAIQWDAIFVTSVFIWWLLVLGIIDAKHGILPDEITLSGIWLGLLLNTAPFDIFAFSDLTLAVYGAALGYTLPWSINCCYALLRKRQGMGYGDFKMLAMIGAWLGVIDMVFVLMCASLIGIFYVIARIFVKRVSIDTPIMFGMCLSLATIFIVILRHLQLDWLTLAW